MNLRDDIRQLKTHPQDLRKFGLLVGGVFMALGLLFLWRQKGYYPYFLWPGAGLMGFGLLMPRALKWVYIAWMSMAFGLGFIMAHVLLTLLFWFVLTPVGLLARLTGKDFLRLKLDRNAKSYWIPREQNAQSAADYERQF